MKPFIRPITFVYLSVLLLAGCKPAGEPGAANQLPPSAAVRVQTVEMKRHIATEEVSGTVQARTQARIEAKVAGRIQEMLATPGKAVKAGELLARLDVLEIRARLDQAMAIHQQAMADLKRFTFLIERGAATQAEFDAVKARAGTAGAGVMEAQAMIGYADILAPFDGTLTRKLADAGDLAVPGKVLLEMEDTAHLRLEADIPESSIANVKLGATMPVRFSQLAGELPGVVSEITPAAEPSSRTIQVKLDLPAVGGLRSGQFGRVTVPMAESTSLLAPQTALVERGQLRFVFVVKEKRAGMRLVKTGKLFGAEIEIVSGLTPGEAVVVENAAALLDGQSLEIKP